MLKKSAHRTHTLAFKAKVALVDLRENKTMAEHCSQLMERPADIRGAPRIAHRVGWFAANDHRHSRQLRTFGMQPGVHRPLRARYSNIWSHFSQDICHEKFL